MIFFCANRPKNATLNKKKSRLRQQATTQMIFAYQEAI
nr:MAG TPA: hypothetical protein [Caudoviricetes sp.]